MPLETFVRDQRDRPRRGYGGQQRVADAMRRDERAHILIQFADSLAGEIGVPVEQREGPLLLRQARRGKVGGAIDLPGPLPYPVRGLDRAVAQPGHHQRVGQPGHAEADPAFGGGFPALRLQRKAGRFDGVVHHADRHRHQIGQFCLVDAGLRRERLLHQTSQVDRSQQAGAIGRQRLLAAGIGRADGFAIRHARLLRALMRSMKMTPGSA
jgi:hypothetical protein